MITGKLLLILLFFTGISFAQNAVTGTVADVNDEPLPFASIFFKNQNIFVNSDLEGKFYIRSRQRLKYSDTLEIRYVVSGRK